MHNPAASKPKTVSIGIQVGPPLKKRPPSIVVPAQEPPLRAYWTHKINLPFPPDGTCQQQQNIQQQFVQPVNAYNYQPYSQFQQQQQPPYSYTQFIPQSFIQQPLQPTITRRQRRNFISKQKYIQRHNQSQ